jgi:hypothetical protein
MDFILDFVFYTVVIGLFLGLAGGKVLLGWPLGKSLKVGMFASFVGVTVACIAPNLYGF